MTPKQERFVQAYCANGGNGTQAAIEAGYSKSGAEVRAHELVRNSKVRDAIETFRAESAERAHVTIESLTKKLEDVITDAAADGQHGARVSAITTIAKLHGLLTEDRKNERTPLKEVLERIERENNGKPRLVAVK